VSILDRIVVGVDGTEWGYEALRQVLSLRPDGGVVDAVTALDTSVSVHAGFEARYVAAQLEEEAELVRDRAEQIIGGRVDCSARIVRGDAAGVLRHVGSQADATLIALGGRRSSRLLGIMLGDTSTTLVHEATCSVLLARPQWGEQWSPRRIVVGLDGSEPALGALAVADELAERLGSTVKVLAAEGGKKIDPDAGWRDRIDIRERGHPVVALLDHSIAADLMIVGSRGLHGLRALGSVSERVAHRADCSVLVVHPGAPPRGAGDA
jgi:nucleotide-binding universal stress UspA family protein